MPNYHLCNRVIDSGVVLSLPGVDGQRADYRFQIVTHALIHSVESKLIRQHLMPDASVWLELSHHPFGYHFHFPALADFLVSADGVDIRCAPQPGVPDHTIEHLLLDQVLPCVFSHQGHTLLHASAVHFGQRAVAFLGDAGWGKSTLTASLCQRGLPLITDDCLLLTDDGDRVLGTGSYPGLRLWPDSLLALGAAANAPDYVSHYSSKRRLTPQDGHIRFCDGPVPLSHLYVLAPPAETDTLDTVRIEPISLREGVILLLGYSFRLDTTDRARNAREFQALSHLVERLPLYRLSYPRRYDVLPAVQQALLAHGEEVR